MDKKIVLGIDFCNLLFGSYYGEKLINSKGENVNAIKGFFFKMRVLKDMFNPDYMIIANDLSRNKTFRRKLYPPYKAQRKEHDPDIMKQMEHTIRLCKLIGYPFINNEVYEADDILGMISRYTSEHDMDMVIVSTDKDLYQLINDNTYIFSYRNRELIDVNYLYNKYKLTPDQWIELKMLQGDVSDNIPGIQGIGEITALKLMHQYGSIKNIYNNMGSHKDSLRNSLSKGYDKLDLVRTLVTIITDYTKIDFNPDMLNMKERFENEVYDMLYELELHSLFNVMNYSLFIDKEIIKEDKK